MDSENQKRLIKISIISVVVLLTFLWVNPFSYNDPTERTVVTTQGGSQKCVFEGGIYWSGFFSKEVSWPNRISVSYKAKDAAEQMDEEKTFEIGRVNIRFNDATTADLTGIVQYRLPSTEKEMLEMHNTHGTPAALVKRRLAPYTQECLQSSSQLMSSEMCYSGGRAQMVQDYLDQLKNGAFLLKVSIVNTYDSLEKENKKSYDVVIKTDKNGQAMRKFSSIKEYGISIDDAQITDVDYQAQVDNMLAKKIEAATAASVSKQQLMTAQQQALTAKAQGEKKLVETEYAKKVDQTNQVVAAETKVKLAEQYKFEQKMAAEAAEFAAKKVRTEADAEAYKNRQLVSSGLSPWDKADFEMKTKIGVAEALSKVALPSTYIQGGNSGTTNSLLDALLSTKLIDK
jgi:5-hydroxyisourate hydrolase-like protein (transthyretin family)